LRLYVGVLISSGVLSIILCKNIMKFTKGTGCLHIDPYSQVSSCYCKGLEWVLWNKIDWLDQIAEQF